MPCMHALVGAYWVGVLAFQATSWCACPGWYRLAGLPPTRSLLCLQARWGCPPPLGPLPLLFITVHPTLYGCVQLHVRVLQAR
jgi:hypothetical protein